MTIKDVEERLGITRANVRFYEKEGLLFPKRNPINDYRNYSAEDVETLKKIIFLRRLDVPVDTIRLFIQGKEDLNGVLSGQLLILEQQQEKTEEAIRFCKYLLSGKAASFQEFSIPKELPGEREGLLMDKLSGLKQFWEKIVVWGLFTVQILITLFIYPHLPETIPVEWQGALIVEYRGRAFIFVYLGLSVLCIYGMRLIMYQWLDFRFRCYMDELTAIATVGGIGAGITIEIYTMLSIAGTKISFPLYFAVCAAVYAGFVLLFYFAVKKKGKEGHLYEKKR